MLKVSNTYNTEVKGITFNNIPVNLSNSFLLRMLVILDGKYDLVDYNPEGNIFNFGGNRILDVSGSTFVIEYDNKSDLIDNKHLFEENFIKKGFNSKELEEKRQVPEIYGDFEYKEKYYLILESLNIKTNELNELLGIYKGVILKPNLYFRDSKEIKETTDTNQNRIKDITKNRTIN